MRYLLITLLVGCTSTGVHTKQFNQYDFSQVVPVDICILQDPCVSDERASELSAGARSEFKRYGLDLRFTYESWEAPGSPTAILTKMAQKPLEPPCDRMFVYACRGLMQSAKGFMVSVEGFVDDDSGTMGMAYVKGLSPAVLVVGGGQRVVNHEIEHLFGCDHGLTKTKCYGKIDAMRRQTVGDFPPSWSFTDNIWIQNRVVWMGE